MVGACVGALVVAGFGVVVVVVVVVVVGCAGAGVGAGGAITNVERIRFCPKSTDHTIATRQIPALAVVCCCLYDFGNATRPKNLLAKEPRYK